VMLERVMLERVTLVSQRARPPLAACHPCILQAQGLVVDANPELQRLLQGWIG